MRPCRWTPAACVLTEKHRDPDRLGSAIATFTLFGRRSWTGESGCEKCEDGTSAGGALVRSQEWSAILTATATAPGAC